jgi:lysophospholipase L1-like esterase
MNDNELNNLIRQGSPPPNFPASFQREVWQRIAVTESRSLSSLLARIGSDWLQWIVKPAGAVATIMTMLIIGAGLGGIVSAKESESNLKAAYTASINPILSAHTSEK